MIYGENRPAPTHLRPPPPAAPPEWTDTLVRGVKALATIDDVRLAVIQLIDAVDRLSRVVEKLVHKEFP